MINSFSGRWHFLSNFHPCKIEYQGIVYPSVEHYYVAMKVKGDQFFNGLYITSADCRELISKLPSAGEAKRFGTQIKLRKDWDIIKLSIMEWGLIEKFKDESLKQMLLSTGDQELIEENFWHDNFWGSCSCSKCNNSGDNNLGKLLMKIRKDI
jgi:hypothetical protein